ncbi:hypothetical protein ACFOOL_16390 [Devosia honganensis]|uniref:KTSC domain-containing protein n=1 Tax=Devosia honganensis TaxID=1610527 RepID=A0ABV7X515_9HYPH
MTDMTLSTDAGFEAGHICNRNGCAGIIEQHDSDGCCSCHINPPCGHCTTPREFCPVCDWDAKDDLIVEAEGTIYLGAVNYVEKVQRVLDPTKIDYTISMHSSSSQKCQGVYPPGTTRAEVEQRVKGTFGGRFESFGGGKFSYIAYTD